MAASPITPKRRAEDTGLQSQDPLDQQLLLMGGDSRGKTTFSQLWGNHQEAPRMVPHARLISWIHLYHLLFDCPPATAGMEDGAHLLTGAPWFS